MYACVCVYVLDLGTTLFFIIVKTKNKRNNMLMMWLLIGCFMGRQLDQNGHGQPLILNYTLVELFVFHDIVI